MEEPSLTDIVRSGNVHLLRHALRTAIKTNPDAVNEALHEAVRSGQTDCFHALLQGGADIHGFNIHGETLILTAITTGKEDIVRDVLNQGYIIDQGVGNSQDTGTMVPVHYAIQLNRPDILEILLNAGANPGYKDLDGDIAIISATMAESLPMVNLLIGAGGKVNNPGYEGNFALHRATELNSLDIINALLEANHVVDVHNDQGDTPLLLACEMGYFDSAQILLKAGANPTSSNNFDQNALHFAAMDGNIPVLELLLGKNPSLNLKDISGNTAILLGSSLCHEDACLLLAEKGADSTVKGSGDRTVAHLACLNGMVRLLEAVFTASQEECNIQDNEGDTAALLAIKNEHWNCLQLVLANKPNLKLCDNKSRNCLHWAAVKGCPDDLLLEILDGEIDLDMKDADGNTPLNLAAMHNRYPMMQILLKHNCDVNAQGEDGRTALHKVAESGYYDMVWQLLQAQALPDIADDKCETPLILAIKGKHTDIVEEILGRGARVDTYDCRGRSPFHWACDTNSSDILNLLLTSEGNLDAVDNAGDTALLIAARIYNKNMVQALVEKGCDLNTIDKKKKTALHYMASSVFVDAVKSLIRVGASVDPVDCAGSPLIDAAKRGQTEVVQTLLANKANVDSTDDLGRTAFLWAVGKGHVDISRILVENGTNTRHADKSGDTALTLASWHGHADLVEYLLPLSDWEQCEEDEGMNALHLAVCRDHKECVRVLLDAGCQVSVTSRTGNNALVLAAIHTSGPDIMSMILHAGQDFNVNQTGEKDRAAIHWSVGDPDSLNVLIESTPAGTLELDMEDINGATPLLLSIAHSQPQSALLLLKAGCDFNKLHSDGRRPLHHSALYGDTITLEALLKLGTDPDTETEEGRTALLLASIEGHVEIVQLLLKYKCNVNVLFMDAITPLSVAADRQFYEIVQFLLEAGADPDTIGKDRHSALMTCTMNGDIQGMCLLLRYNANVDQVIDETGNTLLHAAIAKHNVQAICVLVASGCEVNSIKRVIKNNLLSHILGGSFALNMIQREASRPKTLQQLCRLAIRKHLGFPLQSKVEKLKVPSVMKDYLLLTDLEKVINEL